MTLSITNQGQIAKFSSYTDIELALKNNEISLGVDFLKRTYYTVDVSQAMTSLTKVGDLLKVAYAASKTYKCNQPILFIMGGYQTIINNSYLTTSTFVGCSIKALNHHVFALKAVENSMNEKSKSDISFKEKMIEIAIKQINECEVLAKKMEEESDKRAEEVGNLVAKALQAMVAASEDQTISAEKQREVSKMINDYKSEEAKQKSLADDLAVATQQAREHEQKIMNKADKARSDKMTIAITQAIFGCVSKVADSVGSAYSGKSGGSNAISNQEDTSKAKGSGVSEGLKNYQSEKQSKKLALEEEEQALAKMEVELKQLDKEQDKEKINNCEKEIAVLTVKVKNKREELNSINSSMQNLQDTFKNESDALNELEAKATEIRYKLEAEERTAKSNLKEAAEKLKLLSIEKDDFTTAIQSLDVAIQTMGKVKTVFENVRLYWKGVAAHCNALTKYVSDLKDLKEMEDFDGIVATINASGLNWITLGKINHTAQISMESVKSKIDINVSNLPSLEEAKNILKDFSPIALIEEGI